MHKTQRELIHLLKTEGRMTGDGVYYGGTRNCAMLYSPGEYIVCEYAGRAVATKLDKNDEPISTDPLIPFMNDGIAD